MDKDKERQNLIKALDEFGLVMREKLLKKLDQGYRGWDSSDVGFFRNMLVAHIHDEKTGKDQAVDIANLAMFLYFAKRRIGGDNDTGGSEP
jgi:hypothetical protein